MTLIGLDCATQPAKTGLALAHLCGDALTVRRALVGRSAGHLVETLARWLDDAPTAVLALDAPLGWPAPLAACLPGHRAGDPLAGPANDLFRRETDRAVHRAIGKTPLDVGADRIARTALAALGILEAVRQRVPVQMGWTPGAVVGRQAVEVYSAAVLRSRGLRDTGYKAPEAAPLRAEMLDALGLDLDSDARRSAVAVDHAFDAVLCCVAAADYARGHVIPPDDDPLARQEGWIWVRPLPGPG